MKSENSGAPPVTREAGELGLFTRLRERSVRATPGETADLSDLERDDPCGAANFTALARRFGWARSADGSWVLERHPRWAPGWIDSALTSNWHDLFESAFGYRMPEPLRSWKYRDNALAGMGAWRDGALVGFYGGMTRGVLFFGKPEFAAQIGDVMVRPEERGVMTRTGPFQLAASTFLERSMGYGRRHLLGFGFPTDKALKVGQKMGLYEQVDQMMELAWDAKDHWTARLDHCQALDAAHAEAVDSLWARMASRFQASVLGVRDWAYVRGRFLDHPINRYECLLVRQRFSRRPKGVVVLRDQGDDGLELLDLIGDPDEFEDLVRAARRRAAQLGRSRVFMWLTEGHAPRLAASNARIKPLGLMVPANVWTAGPSVAELTRRWWLTGGDADFR